jgi:hypothetical protein
MENFRRMIQSNPQKHACVEEYKKDSLILNPSESLWGGEIRQLNPAKIVTAWQTITDPLIIIAGQNYTSASYTFTGAGSSASVVQDEFRDDAVFEVRLTNATDSSGIIGGQGYTSVENNAQTGDDKSIVIAASDVAGEKDYLGMRLFVNSGTGAGQYGTISYFDTVSKTASIDSESSAGTLIIFFNNFM